MAFKDILLTLTSYPDPTPATVAEDAVAIADDQLREVAYPVGIRGHRRDRRFDLDRLAEFLIVPKEERLIRSVVNLGNPDRSAKSASVIVPTGGIF